MIRADLPGLRLRRIRLELAAALEAAPAPAPHDLVRAATWRLDSGQADDPERLLAAARAARAVSLDVAERLARRAHETQRSLPATVLLAEILTHRGRGDEAAALTSGLPPESLSVEQREALTYIAAVAQGLLTGDTAGGANLVAELAGGDPLAGQYLHAAHSAMLAFDARLPQALELGLPIVLDPAAAPETRTLAAVAPSRQVLARSHRRRRAPRRPRAPGHVGPGGAPGTALRRVGHRADRDLRSARRRRP